MQNDVRSDRYDLLALAEVYMNDIIVETSSAVASIETDELYGASGTQRMYQVYTEGYRPLVQPIGYPANSSVNSAPLCGESGPRNVNIYMRRAYSKFELT